MLKNIVFIDICDQITFYDQLQTVPLVFRAAASYLTSVTSHLCMYIS